jgi:hypoxanthine phosphoribosyltransferase
VYLAEHQLRARVRELGVQIAADYAGRDLVLVTVLKGAFVFLADLSRAVSINHALDFVVLVVENVIDTGLTLNYLMKTLALKEPRDLAACTLLDRPYRRLVDDLPLRYVGFTVPDEFFVGYGFDLEGRHRGLRDLRIVERR